MSVNLVLVGLLLRIDIAALGHYDVAAEEVGRYSLAVRAAESLWLIPLATAQIFAVRSANEGQTRGHSARLLSTRSVALVAPAGLLAVAVTWLAVSTVIPDYKGAEILLLLLAPGIAFYAGVPTLRNFLALENRLLQSGVVTALALCVNLGCNAVLIPRLGAAGAAIATSIAYSSLAFGCRTLAKTTG